MTITHKKISEFILEKAERDFDPRITKDQIMVKPNIALCWGIEYFRGISEKGLYLKVNGYKHKGYVVVTLGFMDTYDIHLLDLSGNQVGETVKDIYCDQLTDVIDSLVETT